MTDYKGMKLTELRRLAIPKREKTPLWSGAELMDAPKEDIAYFLKTGAVPPLTCKEQGEGIIRLNRRSFTRDEFRAVAMALGIVTENQAPQYQERPKAGARRTGRPAASLPDDTKPLLETFRNANRQGQAFYRTGKHGVFARRDELSEEFRQIGRDRLEKLIGGMLQAGEIVTADGKLTVPETFQECKIQGGKHAH
ncbi:hypothetical protein [Pelotalea chapellei]|uniref:Uncharacterized protein n=1 Tax=Pelotalea chapellei TaxID=44671 RepID=A0ABS5U5R3_9BACT|nr:hypothetical protein [Pelotalea chapellei]MBT1070992.1 hypothetical protein [Pelotalea chapellei]